MSLGPELGKMWASKRCIQTFYVALMVCTGLVAATDDLEAWDEFKNTFDKLYKNVEEEDKRMRIFIENKQYIESHNTKSGASFIQGMNSLSDLTTEEINRSRNGLRIRDKDDRPIDGLLQALLVALNRTAHTVGGHTSAIEMVGADADGRAWYEGMITPPEVDWRTSGRVSKVKDQGSCGSCWAFATTGALESVLVSHNRSILLSEQNLVDCSRRYGNYGCSGGMMDAALRYVRDQGIMSSQEYPYVGENKDCKFKKDKTITNVRGSAVLPRGNEQLLRLAVALTGPIPIAIDASAKSFHHYKSGIYNDSKCRNSVNHLNHAVLLVGYGTDPVQGDYWIIKNSWGRKWGDHGYVKIARNHRNLCGVASYAVLPVP